MINSITMTVPLAFEPKSRGMMQQPPRNPDEPLLTRKLVKRILVVSLFNWILIFGMFEWAKSTTGDVTVARTMAIQLNLNQWLICLLPMLPMIPMAFVAHFIDPA